MQSEDAAETVQRRAKLKKTRVKTSSIPEKDESSADEDSIALQVIQKLFYPFVLVIASLFQVFFKIFFLPKSLTNTSNILKLTTKL